MPTAPFLAALLAPLPVQVPLTGAAPAASAPVQVTQAADDTVGVLEAAAPEARALWTRFLAAARATHDLEPVRAFVLDAQVRDRDGVRTNELDIRYHFLEPHYIRFRLPKDKETGRGPTGPQGGYWLRDGDEVVQLAGREYSEDRALVQRMTSLSRNFLALTDPERIRLERLELLSGPDFALDDVTLRRLARRLDWIRVASPSFGLAETVATERGDTVHRVDLGLDRETRLPTLVAIRREGQPAPGEPAPRALLIHLQDYRGRNGYVVPHLLHVYAAAARPTGGSPEPGFGGRPSQEIGVLRVDLRPELRPEDFTP